MLWTKRAHQCTIFRLLGVLMMKGHPIPHAFFETTKSDFSNFASLFSFTKDNSSVFFLAQTSYTLDKNNLSEWNFWTFVWLGENSPNTSCYIYLKPQVSWYQRVVQNLKKNLFFVSKMTGIWRILIRALKSLKKLHFD